VHRPLGAHPFAEDEIRQLKPRQVDVHGSLRVGIGDHEHAVAQLDPIDSRVALGRNRERDQTRRS
jgi:hypothetical protein